MKRFAQTLASKAEDLEGTAFIFNSNEDFTSFTKNYRTLSFLQMCKLVQFNYIDNVRKIKAEKYI